MAGLTLFLGHSQSSISGARRLKLGCQVPSCIWPGGPEDQPQGSSFQIRIRLVFAARSHAIRRATGSHGTVRILLRGSGQKHEKNEPGLPRQTAYVSCGGCGQATLSF